MSGKTRIEKMEEYCYNKYVECFNNSNNVALSPSLRIYNKCMGEAYIDCLAKIKHDDKQVLQYAIDLQLTYTSDATRRI